GCAAASLLLGAWFYRGLAGASGGSPAGPFAAGRDVPRAVLSVLGLLGAVLGIGLLLGVPVVLLVAFTALLSPPVAVIGVVLVAAALILAAVHPFFALA